MDLATATQRMTFRMLNTTHLIPHSFSELSVQVKVQTESIQSHIQLQIMPETRIPPPRRLRWPRRKVNRKEQNKKRSSGHSERPFSYSFFNDATYLLALFYLVPSRIFRCTYTRSNH
jgi:hypothetical protein